MSTDGGYRFTQVGNGPVSVVACVLGDDITLDPACASVLQQLENGAAEGFDEADRGFLAFCRRRGWVDDDLRLNGTFRSVARTPHLSRLQIELSTRCNFACAYCYSESGPTQAAALTTDQVLAILRDADRVGVTWVDFTGGEVLIYPDWKVVVQYARQLGMVVSVHSNGLLLTDRNVDFLVEVGIHTLQVTVESHHADVHEAVGRGTQRSHAKVLEGIRRAKRAGINVRLAALVHKKNADHISEAVRWFHDELGTPISLDRVMTTGVEGATDLAVSEPEFWEIVSPLLGVGAASSGRICDPLSAPAPGAMIEPECGVAHSFVYLTADGRFSLCPTMTHREEQQFAGPSVAEMTLIEAWYESATFTAFRGLNCENIGRCPAASACGGGCRSNAYIATGRLTAPDVIACNTHKNPNKVFVNFLGRYEEGKFAPVAVS